MTTFNKYMLWIALMLPLVGIAGEKEDGELVKGICDANYDAVNAAIEAGARLNQQLNNEGQTPLALAQELLQEANTEVEEVNEDRSVKLQNIIALLRANYAPIYVMYHNADETYNRPNATQAEQPSPFGIFPQDIQNFLLLISE